MKSITEWYEQSNSHSIYWGASFRSPFLLHQDLRSPRPQHAECRLCGSCLGTTDATSWPARLPQCMQESSTYLPKGQRATMDSLFEVEWSRCQGTVGQSEVLWSCPSWGSRGFPRFRNWYTPSTPRGYQGNWWIRTRSRVKSNRCSSGRSPTKRTALPWPWGWYGPPVISASQANSLACSQWYPGV